VVLYSTAIWIAITVDSPNHQSEVFFFLVCCHNVVSIDGARSLLVYEQDVIEIVRF